ncbi:sugar ABC transporter substrate-binding protein [Planosporangium mesophilum]|uniref:Sugar ABC transporter substrate-binding protein n=1 Tax=Planosporangium mesophilum TaxID=689768 RepID=A0A8J3TCA1_9ACTN|nr:sugar ABC transporter substrate-binding protein [Planosporangium mesophilum]NJC82851.1 sugar ABC transporter substrate-binding protein [Planosporangium mesophilum]GII23679.1 sugar ABC transporter substrate-binding protein [Planosporangium mesophilum]
MSGHRRTAALVLASALALAAAACSSTGGKQEENGGAAANAGKANTPRVKIAMVTHEAPGDTFWSLVRKGAEAAAAKDNVQLVYTNDPQAAQQSTLVQNAVDQKVAGIAVTLSKPDALKGAVQNAVAAGIPVVALNAGQQQWKDVGAMEFFGQDESVAGEAAGRRLATEGAKKVLCVIHEQGSVALEARCAGVAKGLAGAGTVENVTVTGTDMPSVKQTLTAKLQQDRGIDRVIGLGAPFALTAVQAAKDTGSTAKVATFDTNRDLVNAIRSGDVQWAIDQQPYLQGYLAVDALWLYLNNGNTIGGGQTVLTGPAFVDKKNVDAIATYANNGTR